MQEICWKEPDIINEIEKQRALQERPQRIRNVALFLLAAIALGAVIVIAAEAFGNSLVAENYGSPVSKISFSWDSFWGVAPILILNLLLGFHSAWQGAPHIADSCRVSKLGALRLNAGEHIAWHDIANYRFEPCDDTPNLRVLIVEARGRKAPLRLYYEGEQLEARLRDVMAQGTASTRETISQGTMTA